MKNNEIRIKNYWGVVFISIFDIIRWFYIYFTISSVHRIFEQIKSRVIYGQILFSVYLPPNYYWLNLCILFFVCFSYIGFLIFLNPEKNMELVKAWLFFKCAFFIFSLISIFLKQLSIANFIYLLIPIDFFTIIYLVSLNIELNNKFRKNNVEEYG